MWGGQSVITSRAGDAQAVERNVPGQLLPVSARQAISHLAGNTRLAEHRGYVMSARFWKALEFAKDDKAVFEVPDQTRLEAIQADEA